MQSASALSRRCALLIVIISPAFLGSYFRCVAVSNPSTTTARIDRLDPVAPTVGEVMQASGSGTGTPPLYFAWDFGDGTVVPTAQAAHVYKAQGRYRVTLTVRDTFGQTSRDSQDVSVSARLSSSAATLVLISDAVAGEPVVFTAFAPDPYASALTYVWTFSDGQSATGPEATATFPTAGLYVAWVTAANDRGVTTIAEVTFEVAATTTY